MRASDLIGRDVLDAAGQRVGVITDLRCIQDGPLRGRYASLRVDAALVSGRHVGSTLGYDRRPDQGPWLIRLVVRWLHRDARVIAWTDLVEENGAVRLRRSAQSGR
jgi:hypothetical protein